MNAGQLRDAILRQIWPSGEPEALLDAHRDHFQEVLALISKWVPEEQEMNVNTVAFCKTTYKCGMTVVPKPNGVVRRVFTVCGENFCDPVFYYQRPYPEVEQAGRRAIWYAGDTTLSGSTGKAMPMGFQDADASTDAVCGRARRGTYAIYRGNLYISPFIQSTEMVVIEWDGIKNLWEDGDPLNESQQYRSAVKLFMQWAHERDYGTVERAMQFHNPRCLVQGRAEFAGHADVALAELMHEEREKVKERPTIYYDATWKVPSRLIDPMVVDACLPPTTPGPLVLAHVGNFGSGDSNSALVAALVASFGPSAVIASAVNAYNSNTASQNYDDEVGKGYHQYIFPYVGSQGDGAAKNGFWPSPGTVDWQYDGDLSSYLGFFALPNNGRYYDVCLGPVHLFIIDGLPNEVDGQTEDSAQAQWLKAKLWLSNAPWKIVVLGDQVPYSTLGSTNVMRWPFKSWGADMVLSGLGNYERVSVISLPYINNGSGGRALQTTGNAVITGRQFYDQTHYGAGRIIASSCSIRYEFIDTDGVLLDSLQLNKPLTGPCAGQTIPGTLSSSTIQQFLPPVAPATEFQQQVFNSAGDPNGVITAGPLPALCYDETNKILWTKDDGVRSATGWH